MTKAKGMKANVDSKKNPKRCDGILEQRSLNNVASKIYLTLLCSPFLYFFNGFFFSFFYW